MELPANIDQITFIEYMAATNLIIKGLKKENEALRKKVLQQQECNRRIQFFADGLAYELNRKEAIKNAG